jgi:malate dehydrogenase (oxaloacetate-decarboxylating)
MGALDLESLDLHAKNHGKIAIKGKIELNNRKDLSLAYTPGVAAVSSAIGMDKALAFKYTIKHNSIAVVSDGSAILGLGNLGAAAAIPVMEGKCLIFNKLAGIDAFPLCIDVHTPDEIVAVVKAIAPVFGGINLEDIAAPKCFEIESRLRKELDIPVMHDDQHATAVVVLAGLINALKVVGKQKEKITVVVNGAGAAGLATARMILNFGVGDLILVDTKGAIYRGRAEGMNPEKEELAILTNKSGKKGTIADVIRNSDVFIGVSAPGILTGDMVKSMAPKSIVFAMANPVPEIMPDIAKAAGAAVVATGRSDFPNQVNNALAFPGIFRGALDSGTRQITEKMKLAAALKLSSLVPVPSAEKIVPDPLDPSIVPAISKAVADAAKEMR